MNSRHWLAVATGIVAIFLLLSGGIAAWTIGAVHQLEVIPGLPFTTAEDVAWAKSYLPVLYFLAAEGLLFGAAAVVAAWGVIGAKPWVRATLFVTSVLLAFTAVVAIFVAPRQWDTQAVFIGFCVLLWWEARRWP